MPEFMDTIVPNKATTSATISRPIGIVFARITNHSNAEGCRNKSMPATRPRFQETAHRKRFPSRGEHPLPVHSLSDLRMFGEVSSRSARIDAAHGEDRSQLSGFRISDAQVAEGFLKSVIAELKFLYPRVAPPHPRPYLSRIPGRGIE